MPIKNKKVLIVCLIVACFILVFLSISLVVLGHQDTATGAGIMALGAAAATALAKKGRDETQAVVRGTQDDLVKAQDSINKIHDDAVSDMNNVSNEVKASTDDEKVNEGNNLLKPE